MDYVEQLQSLDETAGRQVIFDALNTAALAALSDMKNESTTTNNKKLDVFHNNELVHTTSNAKTKQEAIKQAKLKYPEKTGKWTADVHSSVYGDTKKLTEESLDEMSEEDFDSLVENIEQLDELSQTRLRKYVADAKRHIKSRILKQDAKPGDDDYDPDYNESPEFKHGVDPYKMLKRDNNVAVTQKKIASRTKPRITNEDIDQLDESRVIALLKAAKQLGYKHYKDIPEESDDMVKLQELSTKFQNDDKEKPVTKEDTDQLDESRKIDQFENGIHKATVHKEDGEYKVKFHTNDKHLPDADYFTDDKDDAVCTAKHQISQMKSE